MPRGDNGIEVLLDYIDPDAGTMPLYENELRQLVAAARNELYRLRQRTVKQMNGYWADHLPWTDKELSAAGYKNSDDNKPKAMNLSELCNKIVTARSMLNFPTMDGKNYAAARMILDELVKAIPRIIRRYDV